MRTDNQNCASKPIMESPAMEPDLQKILGLLRNRNNQLENHIGDIKQGLRAIKSFDESVNDDNLAQKPSECLTDELYNELRKLQYLNDSLSSSVVHLQTII